MNTPPPPPVWPQLDPVAPPLEELPENPTQAQVVKVLVSTLLAFGHLWPRIVQALIYLKCGLERIEHLPPMRRSEDTGSYLIHTSQRVGEAAKAKAQQIEDDPNAKLTPDVVGDIARAEAREILAQEREANRISQLQAVADKVVADKVAADKLKDDLAKEKRERNRLIVVGVVVGTVMLLIGGIFTFMWGRVTGHEEGFAERDKMVQPAVVPVPMPLPIATASAALPAPPASTGRSPATRP